MKKIEHIYRWRTSWKQRRNASRPTENEALRNVGGYVPEPLPQPPSTIIGNLGETLLLFLVRATTGFDLRTTDDVLVDTLDFDARQRFVQISEHLDRKGRLTYWNETRRQYQKTDQPLLIADTLNGLEVLHFQVSPGDVQKAQKYRVAQEGS